MNDPSEDGHEAALQQVGAAGGGRVHVVFEYAAQEAWGWVGQGWLGGWVKGDG